MAWQQQQQQQQHQQPQQQPQQQQRQRQDSTARDTTRQQHATQHVVPAQSARQLPEQQQQQQQELQQQRPQQQRRRRDATAKWEEWRRDAERHAPVRSGRAEEHAANRARGDGGGNKGIGRGMALGTELATRDFRRHTRVCGAAGCDAIIDEHWQRRGDEERRGLCSWCGRRRGASRKRHLDTQLAMATALEGGERRLVEMRGGDSSVWTLPEAAAREAASAARRRADLMREHPPTVGRPRKQQGGA